jgi:hypothetical protein
MSPRAWLTGGLLADITALAFSQGNVWPAHAEAPAPLQPAIFSKGVVAVIRELQSDHNGTRRFEMTIRMRNGTMRVSNETGGARWRAGDKVFLIGMPAAPNR